MEKRIFAAVLISIAMLWPISFGKFKSSVSFWPSNVPAPVMALPESGLAI